MSDLTTRTVLGKSNLLVIKIGSVLVRGDALDQVNQEWMDTLAQDVAAYMKSGKKVVIVSSGGVALGRQALNIPANMPPNDIPLAKKQASSSVGQYHLFNGYYKAFSKQGLDAAQVLLTMSETENRRMNLNAREALHTLLDHGIVPIINENDVVSTGEIRFGDNDRLSVRVAQMILADTVLLLSTTDGLYTDNPDTNANAQHIPVIESLGDDHVAMAGDAVAGLSTGGMKSKIEAAFSATKTGIHLIISEGRENNVLSKLCENAEKRSSLFVAKDNDANARKVWISSHMSPKGAVFIDDGAMNALKSGKSLLPIGVKNVEGEFKRGDVIEVKSLSGEKLAMGLSAYSAHNARLILGRNSADIPSILGYIGRSELVHRNDMVVEA